MSAGRLGGRGVYPRRPQVPRSAMLRRGSRSGYRVRFGGLQSNPPPEKHSSAPNGPRGQALGEGTDRAPDHAGRRVAGAAPARPEPINPLIRYDYNVTGIRKRPFATIAGTPLAILGVSPFGIRGSGSVDSVVTAFSWWPASSSSFVLRRAPEAAFRRPRT
jgi:hypothetical protein